MTNEEIQQGDNIQQTNEPIYKTKSGQIVTQSQLISSKYTQDIIDRGVKDKALTLIGDTKYPDQEYKTSDNQIVSTKDLLASKYTQDVIDRGVHEGALIPIEKKNPLQNTSKGLQDGGSKSTIPTTPTWETSALNPKTAIDKVQAGVETTPIVDGYKEDTPINQAALKAKLDIATMNFKPQKGAFVPSARQLFDIKMTGGAPKPTNIEESVDQDKDDAGTRTGYWWNSILSGIGSVSSGASDLMMQALTAVLPDEAIGGTGTPEQNREDALKQWRQQVEPDVREGVKKLAGANVSSKKQKQFDDEFFTSAVGGLAGTIPMLLGTRGTGLFLGSYDMGLETINNTEEGKKLPESVKSIFGIGVGVANAALEKYGIDKIFGKQSSKVATKLAIRTMSDLVKKSEVPITTAIFEQALNANAQGLKKRIVSAGGKLAGSATTEFITGGLQESANILAEEIVNKTQNKQVFEPSDWGGKGSRIFKSASQEAVGGGLIGVAALPFSKTRNYISEKVAEAKSPEDIQYLKNEILKQAESGKFNQNEVNETVGLVDKYAAIHSKIPVDAFNKKEVAEDIIHRDELEQHIEEKKKELEATDVAFKPEIEKEILALQNTYQEINNNILNKSTQPEVLEIPEGKAKIENLEDVPELKATIDNLNEEIKLGGDKGAKAQVDLEQIKKDPVAYYEKLRDEYKASTADLSEAETKQTIDGYNTLIDKIKSIGEAEVEVPTEEVSVTEKIAPVETKENDTIELPAQVEGGLPRKMIFKEGEWKQQVGDNITDVGENIKQQAQTEFDKKTISSQYETIQPEGKGTTGEIKINSEKVQYNGTDVIGSRERPQSEKIAARKSAKEKIKNLETNAVLKSANTYNTSVGLPKIERHEFKPSDPVKQTEIANLYPKLQDVNSPSYKETDLEKKIYTDYKSKYPQILEKYAIKDYKDLVKKSYAQLIHETELQFNSLPVKVSFHEGDKGYENSSEMMDDVHNFNHLWVFKGGDDHTELGSKTIDKNGITANDKFRAVHDYETHAAEGYEFGKDGEENAWIQHSKIVSPLAQWALSSETRGQNSFVNYSGINTIALETIKTGSALKKEGTRTNDQEKINEGQKLIDEGNNEFKYAEQKAMLLPPDYADMSKFHKTVIKEVPSNLDISKKISKEAAPTPSVEAKPKVPVAKTKSQQVGEGLLTYLGVKAETEKAAKPVKKYTSKNIDSITTEGLNKTQAKVVNDVKNVVKSISTLVGKTTGKTLEVNIHESPATYEEAVIDAGGTKQDSETKGFYLDAKGTIHLNMNKVTTDTMLHEGFHPVLDYMADNRPEIINSLHAQLAKLSGGKEVIERANRIYKSEGEITQKKEAITDYIAQIADGTLVIDQTNFEKVKQYVVDTLNKLGFDIGRDINTIEDLRQLARVISEKFATGEAISIKDVNENQNFQPIKNNGEVGDVYAAGKIDESKISDAKVMDKNPLQLSREEFKETELVKLPIKSLKEVLAPFGNRAIAINSDPSKVGKLKLLSGEEIFMYGGLNYSAIKANVEGEIGFSSTDLLKPKQIQKAIPNIFPDNNGEGLILTTSQSPESMKGDAYALEYVLDALKLLPKSVLKSTEFKTEFFGKDVVAIKDAFGEKKYNEFLSKYGRADFSNEQVMRSMISDLLNNVGGNFVARNSLVSNMLAGVTKKSTRKATEGEPGYISVAPNKFISKQLLDRFDLNQEKLFYEIGEKGIVDVFMNKGEWGFVTGGFTSDSKVDYTSIQDKGIVHPQFNAKFHGKNPFILDGGYQIDKLFKPELLERNKKGELYIDSKTGLPKPYEKKASLMVAGSMYPKGEVVPTAEKTAERLPQFSKEGKIEWEESKIGRGDRAITERNENVKNAAEDLYQGKIDSDEYTAIVDKNSPTRVVTNFIEPAKEDDIKIAVGTKSEGKVNLDFPEGKKVGVRLDIPAYINKNIWAITVHEQGANGSPLSYNNVARLRNVEFITNPAVALDIARHKELSSGRRMGKATIARMMGEWIPIEGDTGEAKGKSAMKMVEEIKDSPEWVQIGMNPFRFSHFYDRATGTPIVKAEEIVQIGGLVYGKNVETTSKNDPRFTVKDKNDNPILGKEGKPIQFSKEEKIEGTLDGKPTTFVKHPEDLEVVNGFYSPIEKRLLETKAGNLSANKWKDVVGKGDEAKFTGILGWLESLPPTQQLKKSEVQNWMKENRIEISEIVKGEKNPFRNQEIVDDIYNSVRDEFSRNGKIELIDENKNNPLDLFYKNPNAETYKELEKFGDNNNVFVEENPTEDTTKYGDYQLPGEKTNYKEVLVTLPKKGENAIEEYNSIREDYDAFLKDAGNRSVTDAERAKNEQFKSKLSELKEKIGDAGYIGNRGLAYPKEDAKFKSSHYDEPNILAHVRMNTRVDAEGNKVLHIEEFQSDWGQKGKKEGFEEEADLKRYKELQSKVSKGVDKLREEGKLAKNDMPANFDEFLTEKEQDELGNLGKLIRSKGYNIPQAPFVTKTADWTKLAWKVALKEAVKEGADKITWTTGEQQNERYDLSKQVDNIHVEGVENVKGVHLVDIELANGGKEYLEVENGIIREGKYEGKRLDDVIGKEYAEKVLSVPEGKTKVLKGEDLKLGGKGMIGFYGSPTEGKLGIVGEVAKSLFKQEPKTTELKIGEKQETFGNLNPETLEIEYPPIVTTQHSIDITPEMKAQVEAGLPQFSKGKDQESQIKEYIDNQRKEGVSEEDIRAGIESVSDKLGLDAKKIDSLMEGEVKPAVPTAKPEPTPQPEGKRVGLSKAEIKKQVEEFDMLAPSRREKITDIELDQMADDAIEAGYDVEKLVEKLRESERTLPNDLEVVILNKYAAALNAEQTNNPSKETLKKYTEVMDAARKGLSLAGATLRQAKRNQLVEDNVSNFLVDKEVAQGAPLSEKQIIEETAKYKELKEAKDKLEAQLKIQREAYDKLAAEVGFNKARAMAKKAAKKSNTEYVAERKASVEAARAALKNLRTGQSGLNSISFGVNELMAIAPHVKDFVKSLANQGVDKLDNVITQAHAEFKDVLEGLSPKDIRNIIAGKYDEVKETRNELAAKMRLLQREAKLLNELDAARKGEETAKTEKERVEKSRRIDELEKQIIQTREINNEDVEPIEKTNAERLATRQKQLLTKIDNLTTDLKEGNFAPEKKELPPLVLDRKTIIMMDKVVELENKIRLERERDNYEKKAAWIKGYDKVMQTAGIKRIVQTAYDLSVSFRQGATLLSPRQIDTWGTSFKNQINSIFSPSNYNRLMYEIRHSKDYHDMVKDGIVFNDLQSVDPEQRNEDFQKSFVYKMPILKESLLASNRAADGFLNTARYELYMKFKRNLEREGITRQSDPEAYKQAAKWAMNMTGRGNLLSAFEHNKAQTVLGNTFYGARLMASRINMLNPVTYFRMRKTRMGREAIKDITAWIGTIMAIGAALAAQGADVSLDPDDSDFLQVKYGDKRYDITGGMAGYARTSLRLFGMIFYRFTESKKEADKYAKFAGMSTLQFFRNKLAPNTAYAADFAFGKGGGEEFDPYDALKIYPMYVDDVVEAYKEDGVVSLATVLLPNLIGIGYNSYEKTPSKRKERKKGKEGKERKK